MTEMPQLSGNSPVLKIQLKSLVMKLLKTFCELLISSAKTMFFPADLPFFICEHTRLFLHL